MLNLFGFRLDGLDVEGLQAVARCVFVVLTLIGAALLARGGDDRRAGRIVFSIAAVGHFLAWFATMFPLPNVYGANGSMDRENHLGWANMVALGFSPLRTFQVNHIHFEPLWPLITAIASGFDIDRVPLVFQWAPLIMGILLLLSVRFAWSRGAASGANGVAEASFAAIGALLLIAVPGDFSGPYRNPWALTFLLKPNHALGLVLAPLAALALSKARDWKSRLFAGFVLQLVGWAFVIHMALLVVGFAVYVALSFLLNSPDRKKDLLDSATAVGANLVLVSPYLVMLLVGYPMSGGAGFLSLAPISERVFEAPFRLGLLLALSAWATWETHREGHRLGRIFAAQWLSAQILWQAFPLLGLVGLAREQDEVFYWCRFWTGLFAAVGALRLARLFLERVRAPLAAPVSLVAPAAAVSLLLLLPALVPTWWDPARMDQYFTAAMKPLPDWIAEPTRFVREHTEKDAVFAGDRDYARWVAAYGGRRVLLAWSLNAPSDAPHRETVEAALLAGEPESLVREAFDRYGVRYVLITSKGSAGDPAHLPTNPHLQPVFDRVSEARRVVIFKLLREAGSR